MSAHEEPDLLRSDVLGLLDSDPVPRPSEGLLRRTRDVARQLAQRAGGQADLPSGARVGPYVVREVLGRGGQATVYRAEDDQGRAVALKVPRPELVARMVREAQILFHLDHPRIVRIERAVIDADPPYIACELLPGGTLADRLRAAGRLPASEVAAIADQILVALQHGHEKGVVHRDIKPSNVLFDQDGWVKVADFGVGSLRLVEDLGLPQTLVSLDLTRGAGTPIYMAPEQEHVALREDGKVDGRADLYALGKLLYEALTGRSPRTVRPASSVIPGLDPRWDAFLFQLLEDRPQDRFPSAAAAREALTALSLLGPAPTPRPPAEAREQEPADRTRAAPPAPPPTRVERWRRLWLPLSAAIVAGFGLGHAAADPWPLAPLVVVLVSARLILALASGASRRAEPPADEQAIGHLVDGVWRLATAKHGALIAVERSDSLGGYAATGTFVDAQLRVDVLTNIFHPGAPLHDGAVVIRGDRIAAASCFLPLTDSLELERSLGTRHRAAVGLSEVADALVIVVSGETGQVSLAERGRLVRDVEPGEVAAALRFGLPPATTKSSTPRTAATTPSQPSQGPVARAERAPGTEERGPRRPRLVLFADDIERLSAMLREHLERSRARCVLLIDVEGQPVTAVGAVDGVYPEVMAALTAASFAATREVAKLLGESRFCSVAHQGREVGVFVSFVGERTLLATIFDSRAAAAAAVLGHATDLVGRLERVLGEAQARRDDEVQRMGDTLDDMFGRP